MLFLKLLISASIHPIFLAGAPMQKGISWGAHNLGLLAMWAIPSFDLSLG
jgi:hypothetical protein